MTWMPTTWRRKKSTDTWNDCAGRLKRPRSRTTTANNFPISNHVIPAQAGIQNTSENWFPACAAVTNIAALRSSREITSRFPMVCNDGSIIRSRSPSGVVQYSILHSGNACCRRSTPAAVILVLRITSVLSFLNSIRCSTPALAMVVSEMFKVSNSLRPFSCVKPPSVNPEPASSNQRSYLSWVRCAMPASVNFG